MSYSKFSSQHSYARANGYKGGYDEYVTLQYKGYVTICKRCEIKPMKKQEWFDAQ